MTLASISVTLFLVFLVGTIQARSKLKKTYFHPISNHVLLYVTFVGLSELIYFVRKYYELGDAWEYLQYTTVLVAFIALFLAARNIKTASARIGFR